MEWDEGKKNTLWYREVFKKFKVIQFFRSSWMVLCRLAMLASRAASPSLKAASSWVSKVELDLMLQSEHTESTSYRNLFKRCCLDGWTSPGQDRLGFCWGVEDTSLCWRCGDISASTGVLLSLSLCGGSIWFRDIRYWLIRSVGGAAGSLKLGGFESLWTQLPDELWLWRSLKCREKEQWNTECQETSVSPALGTP